MRVFLLSILLSLAFLPSYGQAELDSMEAEIAKLPQDTNRVISLYTLSRRYFDIANYQKAILIGKQSLELAEELKFKKGTAQALNNVGISYYKLEDYTKALDFHNKALTIRLELGNPKDISASYNNIGNVYEEKMDYGTALEFKTKALKLREKLGDKRGIAGSNNNIANIYSSLHDYKMALEYCLRSQNIFRELDDIEGITMTYITAANIYQESSKYSLSSEFAQKALLLADSLGDIANALNAHTILYKNYRQLKDPIKTLFHYEKSIELKDSIFNSERAINLAEEESKIEFAKKEQLIKFEQEKKDATAAEEKKRQRLFLISVIIGLLLVAVFSVFMFNRWRITQKQKKIIEVQKAEVDKQRELADSRRIIAEEQKGVIETQKAEVEKSKHEVEEKNKDITDSINYAQRIQRAVLPHRRDILAAFPESFVLFRPKDIVSGDFYWARAGKEFFHIGCCDCTGHGVPGAFMSLLNISFLNQAVNEKAITEPDKILNDVRLSIVKALNPDGNDDRKDGMDAVLCSIDIKNKILHAACANNPIWYISNGELQEIKPDKMPVGSHDNMATAFTKHSIQLQAGDSIYLFTDGYADQFGGPKNKKFRYKQLEDILLANTLLPMKTQKDILENAFMEWKGQCEQVDDVLVIGIRI